MSDTRKNDGGPAFPSEREKWINGAVKNPNRVGYLGMTLRDWFAGQALAGLDPFAVNPQSAAQRAYNQADAMLTERAK